MHSNFGKVMTVVCFGLVLVSFQNCAQPGGSHPAAAAAPSTSSIPTLTGNQANTIVQSAADQISQLVQSVLGRLPTAAELAAYEAQLANGTSLAALRAQLAASAESLANLNALMNQFIPGGANSAELQLLQGLLSSTDSLAAIRKLLGG